MVITGSGILVEPGSAEEVIARIGNLPGVTFQASSESGSELVVNFEAETLSELERFCLELKANTPGILDIVHLYVNFEEEVQEILCGESTVHGMKTEGQ
jgi:nitrate reductase NapAB chaperone NapD